MACFRFSLRSTFHLYCAILGYYSLSSVDFSNPLQKILWQIWSCVIATRQIPPHVDTGNRPHGSQRRVEFDGAFYCVSCLQQPSPRYFSKNHDRVCPASVTRNNSFQNGSIVDSNSWRVSAT